MGAMEQVRLTICMGDRETSQRYASPRTVGVTMIHAKAMTETEGQLLLLVTRQLTVGVVTEHTTGMMMVSALRRVEGTRMPGTSSAGQTAETRT